MCINRWVWWWTSVWKNVQWQRLQCVSECVLAVGLGKKWQGEQCAHSVCGKTHKSRPWWGGIHRCRKNQQSGFCFCGLECWALAKTIFFVHLCFSTQIWWVYWQPLWQNTWDLKHWRGLKENRCFRICYSVGISVIRQFTIVSLSWEREKRVFPPSSLWSHVQLPSKWSGTVGEGECGAYSSMDREYAHGSEIMILPRANLQDNINQLSIHLCIAIFSFLIM